MSRVRAPNQSPWEDAIGQRNGLDGLHRQILEILLDQVRQDTYPSTTVLDMIEQRLRPNDVTDYTDVLIEKIKDDAYPSLDMLRRLQQFA